MQNIPPCPSCNCPYGYEMNNQLVCPECGFEWTPAVEVVDSAAVVKDSNGNILVNGDTVVIIKNLPVKGTNQSVKAGTKVKNIKLVDGDHNISAKVDEFGAMGLKSEFVRKA